MYNPCPMIRGFESVEFTPITELDIRYPNPKKGNTLELAQALPRLPFTLGKTITQDQYLNIVRAIRDVQYAEASTLLLIDVDPATNRITLRPGLVEIIPFILPMLSIEAYVYGGGEITLTYSTSRNETPWHVDNGNHHRRYHISSEPDEGIEIITEPSYYFDENGNLKDLSIFSGYFADIRPTLYPRPEEVWKAPGRTIVGFYGDTLHRRPHVSERRDYILLTSEY